MPQLQSNHFGIVSFSPESVIEFPRGLPGFEEQHRFLAMQIPEAAPIVFLQSADEPGLCFPALPVLAVDPAYRLSLTIEDRRLLDLPGSRQPVLGEEVACFAILSLRETGPTANLLAPVVVNLRRKCAVQALSADSSYSHQHALLPQEAAACS